MNQNDDNKSSAALFSLIIETAKHPKRKRAIENIKKACDYLEDKKIGISVSEVGRLCEESGPKVQSINNNQEFRNYIKARRAEQKIYTNPKSENPRYETDDPQANAMLYALEAEIRREKLQNKNLKRAYADAGEYDLEATSRTGKLVRLTAEKSSIDPVIADVLRRLLDPEHLRKFGLNIEGDRVIAVDRLNRVFLEKGDFQRLLSASRCTRGIPRNTN